MSPTSKRLRFSHVAGVADPRGHLLALLDDLRSQAPIRHLFCAQMSPVPTGDGVVLAHQPRISLVLDGVHTMRVEGNNGPVELGLRPRDALLMPAGTWRRAIWGAPRSYLVLVFSANYVRVFADRVRHESGPSNPVVWYHTAHGLNGVGLHLLNALIEMWRRRAVSDHSPALINALLEQVSWHLAGDTQDGARKAIVTYQALCEYVKDHFRESINRETAAAAMRIHPNHVSRLFREIGKVQFNDFLRQLRLQHAQRLMEDPSLAIEEVAVRSGFQDAGYFRQTFKSAFGMSPGRYRFTLMGGSDAQENGEGASVSAR